jgi:uncharacterized protein (DUF58 family)
MLTSRGRSLIVLSVAGSLLGLLRGQELLALTSVSVLVWLFVEWALFRVRVELGLRLLSCTREVNGLRSATGTLWTDRPVQIRVSVVAKRSVYIPFLRLEDAVPENLRIVDGETISDHSLSGRGPAFFEYQASPRGSGQVRLQGVCVRVGDLQGLFSLQRFLPCDQIFRVMPTAASVDTSRPTTKRINSLPPPGIHRLQRAGLGSELLELRQYVPGDPPKSIAWKVSARRNCLMTRQYESEVPVRTTLFVDQSYSALLGAFGHRPIDQISFLAATIARSTMANRDPVSLVRFSDSDTRSLKAGSGDRHLFGLLDELATAATSLAPPPTAYSPELLQLAWQVANDRSPELLDTSVNAIPFTWFPIGPAARRERRHRARLGAVFTEIYDLPAESPVRLIHDDTQMAALLQRFLVEAGFAWMSPIVEPRGRELHDWNAKFETLATAMTRSISRSHDHELFVLLIDLIDYTGSSGRLLDVLRVARARHHRVVVICPWPDERLPDPSEPAPRVPAAKIEELLEHSERVRLSSAASRLRQEMRRLGIPVAFSADRRSVQLVLSQAELARSGRTTRV